MIENEKQYRESVKQVKKITEYLLFLENKLRNEDKLSEDLITIRMNPELHFLLQIKDEIREWEDKTLQEIYNIWAGDLSCKTKFSTTKHCYDVFKKEFEEKGFTPEQMLFYYDNFHDLKRIFEWKNHELYIEYLRVAK